MAKALKYDVAGELGYCCLCEERATSRVQLGLERLPVSFCLSKAPATRQHRRRARGFGPVVAVDAWPGRRPSWLPVGTVSHFEKFQHRRATGRSV